ncbi:ArsA family ATPase [Marinospirillum sp. MEB164]|uniref:arsenite-transporting ATPase n=1 Tax=Marinospirillum alkalitolerans TaxID=3123374 RepID=A0ABW8PUR5_9GAMM
MSSLLKGRFLWVGGKGGVGKTTTAAALGLLAAQRGQRCLVVSTDPAHSLGDAYDQPLSDQPQAILPGLDAIEIDPDQEVEAHLERVINQMQHFAAPAMLKELKRQMQLTRLSPGTQEAALLERIAKIMTSTADQYDLVIFDTAPTGHTLRLLALPEAMAAWTDGLLAHNKKSSELGKVLEHLTPRAGQNLASPLDAGEPIRHLEEKTQQVAQVLLERRRLFYQARHSIQNPELNAFLFVMTPEKLPLLETRRAITSLQEAQIPVAAVLVNRVLPATADGQFLQARRAQEALYLDEIDQQFAALPRPRLALLETDVQGLAQLNQLAEELAAAGF